MPEERCKRERTSGSESDDSTLCNNVQSAKEPKSNGLARKSSDQLGYTEREIIERELEAQRVSMERAQNDLLSSYPLAAAIGVPFLPGHHPLFGSLQQVEALSWKMARPSAPSSNGDAGSVTGTGQNSNLKARNSASGSSVCRPSGHDSPAESTTSVEPEDLSLRTSPKEEPVSPKDLVVGDGGSSRDGTPVAEDAASNGAGSASQTQNWSFEEQFKQLYELSDDAKRKEFLDDLFSYMQKRGTPVTRIPIMAKQVLDLYQLYKLVVAHGGLVEVINKKLWREITKGLNLPPSITSAAFTLRTQYMKFLYPYECEREKLSSPSELQAAIDGNRREGRRAGAAGGYNPYSQISPTLLPRAQMNGGTAATVSSVAAGTAGAMTPDDDSILGGLVTPTSLAQHPAFAAVYREHLALEAQRHLERSQRNFSDPSMHRHKSGLEDGESDDDDGSCSSPPVKKQATGRGMAVPNIGDNTAATAAAAAAAAMVANSTAAALASAQERLLALGGLNIPSAHFKITGRGDGRSAVDSSLVVSMEINGVMYQGVLFAQPSASRLVGGSSGQ